MNNSCFFDDTKKDFILHIENGHLLKHISNFLSSYSPSKCEMLILEDEIIFPQIRALFDDNETSVVIRLEKANFRLYELNVPPMIVSFEIKNFKSLCNNLQKKDKVILSISSEYNRMITEVKSNNDSSLKIGETKSMVVTINRNNINRMIEEYKNPENMFDDQFFPRSFLIPSSEIQNLKKNIGIKNLAVDIHMKEDKYLEFSSHCHSSIPLCTRFGRYEGDRSDLYSITTNSSIIILMSKLTQLCKNIKLFEQKKSDSKIKFLKVSAVIDNPFYIGFIDIKIREKPKIVDPELLE